MLRSALLILSGNASAALLLLARNLIIARMIPVADYGIATTFALVMAIIEMSSAMGLQQQIVQDRDGDDPHFQAVLQGFQLLRGCLSGLILFVLAAPLARFMGIPEVAWAYQLMALVPVLNALVHFDIHRLSRHMVFLPMMLTGTLPALVSVLLIWPLAAMFGDWQVMLWAMLAQVVLNVVTSHIVAERPWRLAFDRVIIGRSLRFGWPLLMNAVLLFLIFQADRMIVGSQLGMSDLAIFSMGLTLTLTPTLVFNKSAMNFFLPQLSRAPDEAGFQRVAVVCFQLHVLFGIFMALGAALLGAWLVHLVLGPKYAAMNAILVWLAIQQAIRISKSGPSAVALARGQTENALFPNLLRILPLPLAWWLASRGGDMLMLIHIGTLGELAGLGLAVALQTLRQGVPFWRLMPMLTAALAAMGLMSAWLIVPSGWLLGLSALACLASFALSRDLVRMLRRR